jgi:hypothetical protein
MSIRTRMVAFAATLLLLAGTQSQASFVGTQGFADVGSPTANTGNINTATTLTIGEMLSTSSQSGAFVGLSTQIFGSVSFSTATGANTSLTFGDAAFGTFTSTSLKVAASAPGATSYYILGEFTPGTFSGFGGVTSPQSASITISFTQTPAGSGSISDSATLSVPPSGTIPEPASFAMVVIGLGGVFAVRRFRRRAA